MSKWFMRQGGATPRLRLFCFAYAGGNAMLYRPWQQTMDSRIEVVPVQLPGRGTRMLEPLYTEMAPLVADLAAAIAQESRVPYAFFGHSLGALLGFEIIRYFQALQMPLPVHAFFSGCNAPQMRNASDGMHQMSDADLITRLRDFNGTPPAILANQELMELVLPMIRADFGLAEKYRYRSMPLLPTPFTVLAGQNDDRSSPEQVHAWQRETAVPCSVRWFDGDHFFIHDKMDPIRACIEETLRPLL